MTTEPAKKGVTLSYGVLAIILIATLLIGLLSGAAFGSLFRWTGSWRPGLASEPLPKSSRAWIGISYVPITPAVARSENLSVSAGALIVGVTPNSPADQAGLHEADIVTAVDQRTIDETTSLMNLIMSKQPGDHVVLSILRDNNEQTLEVVLGRSPGGIGQPGGRLLDRFFPR